VLLSCAREDIVVVIIIVAVGANVSVGVDVVVRAYSHSPPSVRAACAKLLKTPWELRKPERLILLSCVHEVSLLRAHKLA
jgi:hypothetical protein